MTKLELLDILDKVFVGQAFHVDPTSKFSVIDVPGTGLRFFSYSRDYSKSNCIWYCGVSVISETMEVLIPNEMSKGFIEEIYEHSKLLNKMSTKIDSIQKRFSEMNSEESIRDMKLKSLGI
jgi:hypothetical protein